nr:uncharacterized protein LOC129272495 [Lytechinus pictus]
MHPQGFKEDLKNAIMHEQGEYIQGSSSDFRRKQARSASHFLGELYNLSRVSSTEFKASVQSVIALALKDWIKAPNVTSTSEENRLLLEVNSECLEEFLILTLRDNDENIKKQVLTLLKEEVLSTTRPKFSLLEHHGRLPPLHVAPPQWRWGSHLYIIVIIGSKGGHGHMSLTRISSSDR